MVQMRRSHVRGPKWFNSSAIFLSATKAALQCKVSRIQVQ
jgi:hypothetical protein